MADTKWSQFPSQTPVNADEVVGLHSGDNARFSIANIVAAVRNGLASIFVPLTRTINGKALSTDITLDSSDIDYDNTGSGLTADDVQEAIDELAQGSGGTTVIANPAGSATDTLTKLQVESTIYSISGGGGGGTAASVTYSNTTSGLTATNVQAAIDEVVDDMVMPTSELIGTGHTLIRLGKLRILTISFYVGTTATTIPVADRPTTAAVGFGVYNDLSAAHMTLGTVTVNTDGSIAFHSWQSYNTSTTASTITSKWVQCPGVIWMTA